MVLEAQRAGIAAARPGATITDVGLACRDVSLSYDIQGFMRHGAVHYVGMEVHDPGDPRRPFEVGTCFTLEPGLYEAETDIGIRSEDVVVITEDGCGVITADVPKEREAVEALMAEQGVLDWMDGR